MAWNDDKEIEQLFQRVHPFMEKMKAVSSEIRENTKGSVNLSNVGIALNNKLVELVQLYRKKGKTFYNSDIKNVIVFYLEDLTLNATNTLNEYLSLYDVNLKRFGLKGQAQDINANAEQILSKYSNITKKIYDFDIEKDIENAVKSHIIFNYNNGLNGGYDHYKEDSEKVIMGYNDELEQLGVSYRLPLEIVTKQQDNNNEHLTVWVEDINNQPLNQNIHSNSETANYRRHL